MGMNENIGPIKMDEPLGDNKYIDIGVHDKIIVKVMHGDYWTLSEIRPIGISYEAPCEPLFGGTIVLKTDFNFKSLESSHDKTGI